MLSGSVSDDETPEGSLTFEEPVMDEVDDMESDMERLLAVTNLDDDHSPQAGGAGGAGDAALGARRLSATTAARSLVAGTISCRPLLAVPAIPGFTCLRPLPAAAALVTSRPAGELARTR